MWQLSQLTLLDLPQCPQLALTRIPPTHMPNHPSRPLGLAFLRRARPDATEIEQLEAEFRFRLQPRCRSARGTLLHRLKQHHRSPPHQLSEFVSGRGAHCGGRGQPSTQETEYLSTCERHRHCREF